MSKPTSGLFEGTEGVASFYGNAEEVIAGRVEGLDLAPHPIQQKELSAKQMKALERRIENRTITAEEYKAYVWNKRFAMRRREGVRNFWKEERKRLRAGLPGTRPWSEGDRRLIMAGKHPKWKGKPFEVHHTYAARLYPQLANVGAILYPATHYEHLMGWHGGSYQKSLPGQRIRKIDEL